MKNSSKVILHIICILLAAALVEVFFVLCLAYFKTEWKSWVYLLALTSGSVLNAAMFTVDIVCYFLKKEAIYKSCITLYAMLAFFAIGFYILLRTGFMEIFQDEGSFEAYLERTGNFMIVLFILLQFLQVVILPIPSAVTVVAGSALFGPFMGSIYSLTGILIGSLVAFLIGRYAGYRVVAWMVGKETLDKWLKKVKGKDRLFLSAMFLLPVFPDDILCFVAGISSMSVWYFFAIILISRVLAIFTTSYSITLIPLNTWWGLLTWGILIALVIVLFIFLYKKSDAILAWFEKKFHRETRVEEKVEKDEFVMEVINPDGAIVKKGV
ncbi:MAG: TVP38/TMEM64 family protein, partial [Clostridia bacterium]|nr:TVP38/TMEM64 family protein [Clostridia bacterium]